MGKRKPARSGFIWCGLFVVFGCRIRVWGEIMAPKAEEKRNITHVASVIVTLLMTGTFIAVWLLDYNHIVFRTHRELGAVCSVLIWVIFYLKFCQVYDAFKIASTAISEIAFSQFCRLALPI